MDLRRDEQPRIARPPAKLNLFLDVLGQRGDGFHELETLMVPVRLWDELILVARGKSSASEPAEIRLSVRDGSPFGPLDLAANSVPATADNLVVRALEALRQRSGCSLGADVSLVKRIPVAAGLGGGSSDAAAALRLANVAWGLGWDRARLAEVAAEIGSDVAFFVYDGPAVCRGRGEQVERLTGLPPLDFVVVAPPDGLSTAEVYRQLAQSGSPEQTRPSRDVAAMIRALQRGRLAEVGRMMHNALQSAAGRLSPWIGRLADVFDGLDFVGHQLSGSGSAYFGICRHAQHARRLAAVLKSQGLGRVVALRSCP